VSSIERFPESFPLQATPVTSSKADVAEQPSAGRLFKSMLHGSTLYSVAILGQRAAGMLLLPVITRFLTPGDYGVMELLDQASAVIALVFGAHYSNALGYFYFRAKDEDGRRAVVGTVILGAAAMGALGWMVCWPLAGNLSRIVFGDDSATFYFRLLLSTMPMSFALEALISWLRVENSPGAFLGWAWFRIGLSTLTLVLMVAVFQLKVLGVVISTVTTFLVTTVAMAGYCVYRARPTFDRRLFAPMLRFTLPLSLGGAAIFFINFGDRFFLRPHISMDDLGLYALSYKLGMLVHLAYSSFSAYWSAQVYAIMNRSDADSVFPRVQTYLTLAITLVCLTLIVCARPMLRLMVDPAYGAAADLAPVIVLAYGVRSLGDYFKFLFLVGGRPGNDAICNWLGAGFCLAGYVFLIPRYGAWGAAFATLIAFTAVAVVTTLWSYRVRPYRLETGRLAKIAAAAVGVAGAYALVPVQALPAQIAWAAFLLAAFVGSLWLMSFATPGERDAGRAALQQLLRRRQGAPEEPAQLA
jgi:O-antigen/teichoic acid export membrane protein